IKYAQVKNRKPSCTSCACSRESNMSWFLPTTLQEMIFDIPHLPYFRKIQQEIFNGSERTAVRGGGTDAKKPTGEAGFFAIPDRSW
ncbi:hypothetical protein, partial [Escherichia coli]|uniref:hypothetical protein n=1 Tax=Escherichia coli TaxID=562 RepID=UPI00248C700F